MSFTYRVRAHSGKMSELKRYTKAQVAEHNSLKSAWVIIDDKIYDLTKFLDEVIFEERNFVAEAEFSA